VDDLEATLPLQVPEVQVRHECGGERGDDDGISDRVSHSVSLPFRQGVTFFGCSAPPSRDRGWLSVADFHHGLLVHRRPAASGQTNEAGRSLIVQIFRRF
jgi:hypothetical protein